MINRYRTMGPKSRNEHSCSGEEQLVAEVENNLLDDSGCELLGFGRFPRRVR